MSKQKWEVKTMADMNDQQFASWLNGGWKVVLATHTTDYQGDTYITATFKRKAKPAPSVYEPQRVYADDPIFGEALEEVLAVSPQGELWIIGDDAGVSDFRYQVRIDGYTCTYARFDLCLGWLKEYVSSLKSAPYTLTDKAKQVLEGE